MGSSDAASGYHLCSNLCVVTDCREMSGSGEMDDGKSAGVDVGGSEEPSAGMSQLKTDTGGQTADVRGQVADKNGLASGGVVDRSDAAEQTEMESSAPLAADGVTSEGGVGRKRSSQKQSSVGSSRRTRGTRAKQPMATSSGEYSCTSCSRSFSSRQDVATHQYMHRENPTSFCGVCNKSFSTETAYRRHAASHNRKSAQQTRAAARPRKTCRQCNQQFDTMKQLSAHHAAQHVDDKPFVCAICGSQFAWPENLKAHQRTHELDPHECDACGRRFVDATSLRVHTRNAHSASSSQSAGMWKQHQCKLCGRSFQFDFSLRAHMKGHAQSPMTTALRRARYYQQPGGVATTTAAAARSVSEVHLISGSSGAMTSLDFGDVISRQQPDSSADQQMDMGLVDPRSALVDAGPVDTGAVDRTRLVWYVKPDTMTAAAAVGENQLEQQQKEEQRQEEQQREDDGEVERQEDEGTSVAGSENVEVSVTAEHQQQQETVDTNSVTTAAQHPADVETAAVASELMWYVKSDAQQQQVLRRADEMCDDDHGGVGSSDGQPAAGAAAGRVVSAVMDAQRTCPHGGELQSDEDGGGGGGGDSDRDADAEDEDDELELLMAEPPRRRAPPSFVYRATPPIARHRRRPRPSEPFLFNCVMTDEKPFVCTLCGECFRSVSRSAKSIIMSSVVVYKT